MEEQTREETMYDGHTVDEISRMSPNELEEIRQRMLERYGTINVNSQNR